MHPPPAPSRGHNGGGMGYYGTTPVPQAAQQAQYYVPPQVSHVHNVPAGLASDLTSKAIAQASISTLANTARNNGFAPPTYSVARVGGKDHSPIFECTVGWNDDSMHEIVQAGSKMDAKRNAALKMISRLNDMGIEVNPGVNKNAPKSGKMQNIPVQHPRSYHYQYQGQAHPSFYMDRGPGNASQFQYQRGLNMPGRNGGANAMMRPANIKADPYADDSYRHLPQTGGNAGGYAHGNGHQRHSYQQNQLNSRSNQPTNRRPLYRPNVAPMNMNTSPLPGVAGSAHPPASNRRPNQPLLSMGQKQPQYNRPMKSEPGSVAQPARYASGGSTKHGNNQNLPSVPRRPNGHGNGHQIKLGDSKDPRLALKRKAIFGGAPTPAPAPKTATHPANGNVKKEVTFAQSTPQTHQHSLYKAAVFGQVATTTPKNTSNTPAPSKEQAPTLRTTQPRVSSPTVSPTTAKLKSATDPVPNRVAAPKNIPITPALNASTTMDKVPSSSDGSGSAKKPVAVVKSQNAKPPTATPHATKANTANISGAKSVPVAPAPSPAKDKTAAKPTLPVPVVRAAPTSSLTVPRNTNVATINSVPSDTAMKTTIGDKMAISISPAVTPKKEKEGPQLGETTTKPAPVQPAVPRKKAPRLENVHLKARNVPRKNPKFLRPQVAPKAKVNNIAVPMKSTEESSTNSAPLKINDNDLPMKNVETSRKESAALNVKKNTEPKGDIKMKDVEDSHGTVNLTATEVPVIGKETALTTKIRPWEITPPPRRSSRNRTSPKKLASQEAKGMEVVPRRRTRSMKENKKRGAEAIDVNGNVNISNAASPKVARVEKAKKKEEVAKNLVEMTTKEKREQSEDLDGGGAGKNDTHMEVVTMTGLSFATTPDVAKEPKAAKSIISRNVLPAKKRPRSYEMKLWMYANGDELSVYELIRSATWNVEPSMNISVHVYGTSGQTPTPNITNESWRSVTHEMEHEMHENAVYSLVAQKAAEQAAKLKELRKNGSGGKMDYELSRVLIVSSSDFIVAATEGTQLVKANVIDTSIKAIADEFRKKYKMSDAK